MIGKIVGDDKDTVHQLEYELLRTECPCNESGVCQEEWFLVEPSGNVKINPEYVVDYESCHEVILHVQVTDTLTELGKNSSEGRRNFHSLLYLFSISLLILRLSHCLDTQGVRKYTV